ncbi:MAG: restriction system protein [Salinirussus sp.]
MTTVEYAGFAAVFSIGGRNYLNSVSDFEELVAAVLRATGYHAKKTPDSHDRGIDLVAHPDSVGFESPYIKAQVKRQQSKVGSPEMQQFSGALGNGERGLFVSTGGYTSGAKDAARNAEQRVTLINRHEFIGLLIQHYDDLESEYQATVPLKQVYIPSQDPTRRVARESERITD